jgi:hypothetical protein
MINCKWCGSRCRGEDAGDDFPDLACLCPACSDKKEKSARIQRERQKEFDQDLTGQDQECFDNEGGY